MVNVKLRSICVSPKFYCLVWTRMEESSRSFKRCRVLTDTKCDLNKETTEPSHMSYGLNPAQAGQPIFPLSNISLGFGITSVNNNPNFIPIQQPTVLLPQSVLQFQPRVLYSTRTNFMLPDNHTNNEPSTSTEYMNMSSTSNRGPTDDYWKVVRTRDKHRYSESKKEHGNFRHSKSLKKDRTDYFGFSNLPRKWEYTENGIKYDRNISNRSGLQFTVMSYNILAQELLENHLYLYNGCSPEALDWEMRSEKILAELKYFKPDIICLQEVQFDHYESVFRKNLMKMGYGCEYLKRSGDKPDGCATFYNLEKFSLLQSTPVEYQKGGLLNRDNVALILELRPNTKLYHGSVHKLCVANTHLLYNPRRGDIKLAQLIVLLAELDKLLYHPDNHNKDSDTEPSHHTKYYPVIVCGDFNSEPHSDIYKFLTSGYFRYEGCLTRLLSGQPEGYYGKNIQLKKHFFCKSFGITDQCQYMTDVLKRHGHQMQTTVEVREILLESNEKTNDQLNNDHSVENSTVFKSSDNCDGDVHGETGESCSNVDVQTSETGESENRESEIKSNEVEVVNTGNSIENSSSETADYNRPNFSHASGKLWHNLNLISAYRHRIQRFGYKQDEVTTQHNGQGCSVDYILYSGSRCNRLQGQPASKEGKIKLLARYGLMSNEEIYRMHGLPNRVHPSDHVNLLTKFLLK